VLRVEPRAAAALAAEVAASLERLTVELGDGGADQGRGLHFCRRQSPRQRSPPFSRPAGLGGEENTSLLPTDAVNKKYTKRKTPT